ncbi:MAG: ribonuclease R [bacterium]|nr:ribonuclease R [bacterium]
MSSERLTERILKFVARSEYQPQQARALARAMGIAEDEYGDFHDAVKALTKSGRMVMGARHAVTLPEPRGSLFGKYRANPRGFGFVIPDAPHLHGDLYVPEGKSGGAMTGDTVRAAIRKRGKRGGKMLYEGRILEIVTRGDSRFVGELQNELGQWFVRPDGNTFHGPIFVGDVGAKTAKAGDQVVAEITEYPAPGRDARGVVVEVLGKRGAPGVDLLSIINQHGLPTEFPPEVLADARKAIAGYDSQAVLAERKDLRDLTVITIDPDTARDFDDAISLTPLPGGKIELGVHIADVAHFVVPGGPLDREAQERSNSAYFPNHVIPMLPEVLSNGLCSLQENQPRLTKSAFITYDRRGKVVAERFANGMIHSAKRLTYGEATNILAGKTRGYAKSVVALLKEMEKLARTIRARRIRAGMLVLNLPEVEVVLNDAGEVVGVAPEDTAFSHTIIEMFMVEANEAVGRLLRELGVPNLRRIHPEPEEEVVESLGRFLGVLGIKAPKAVNHRSLQKLLQEAEGSSNQYAVNLAVLRSMQQAVYSPKPTGHFALASEDYVHFTSPIRRYPDLTIHRLLDAHLRNDLGKRKGRKQQPNTAALEALGELCSTHERRAEGAERELKLVYILRLLAQRLGDVFEGVVTGVANFGVFVQLPEYLVDGLLRFSDLPEDWWEVDAAAGCVVGERTGYSIKLGDRLTVAVAAVDLATRKVNLTLDQPLSRKRKASSTASRKTSTRGRKARKPTGKARKSAGKARRSRRR